METIQHNGEDLSVREISRPADWLCRHLVTLDGSRQFLEYVISVGPFKVDVSRIHELAGSQIRSLESGELQLGELARRLAEEDERGGRDQR